MLFIKNYSLNIGDKAIVRDCSLEMLPGTVHVLMGPNGSGKSSLVASLMGHPLYQVTSGTVQMNGQNLLELATDARAKQGLFLAVQHPIEIEGLQVLHFLQELCKARDITFASYQDFLQHIKVLLEVVGLPESLLQRCVNVGFSGGEKKRFELLQLLLLSPSVVMLDEIDSGVDIDGLKMISNGLLWYKKQNPKVVILLVTHYRKIVDYVQPDFVHVMIDGSIVQSGDLSMLDAIDLNGYEPYAKRS
jgi:Fe-S cluster assembly ATP-binding protein